MYALPPAAKHSASHEQTSLVNFLDTLILLPFFLSFRPHHMGLHRRPRWWA